MTRELPLLTPTTRFSNRAENYVKYRPTYPASILPFLEEDLGLAPGQRIADIGSGTGLFAEPLLEKGYEVVCIEPNDEMRQAAEARLSHFPSFISRRHRAESTGLRGHSIDLITVAQAFHWMDPVLTRQEFTRILRPGGHVVLAWNIQKTDTPFLQAYADLKDRYKIEEVVPPRIDEEKVQDFFEGKAQRRVFPNRQLLNFDALKGQLLSVSYIPLPGHPSYETMISALVQLFVACNVNGFVKMDYETILYWGE